MAVSTFRFRAGWYLEAKTAPDACGMGVEPPARELVLWAPPVPGDFGLGSGLSVSGECWRECFRLLRADLAKGFLRVRFV